MSRILIAGIGNIFMGDDGFGCEVAARLAHETLPTHVELVDFGIRGMDLGYALMDGYDAVLLVDTVDRGAAPGTLYVIEPDLDDFKTDADGPEPLLAPHGMDPEQVLRFVAAIGDSRPRLLLLGCQPAYLGGEHGHMGLSAEVEASIERACAEVRDIIDGLLQSNGLDHTGQATAAGLNNRSEPAPGVLT